MRNFLARRFYFLMSILTALVVVVGFAPNLDSGLIHPGSPRPFALYVHTAVFTWWILLVVVQSGLVQAGQVQLHRRLGMLNGVLGILLPVVGIWVAIAMSRWRLAQDDRHVISFLLVPFFDMTVFAVFFGLAWAWRRRPEEHRRLILLASVSLTVAAFARFPRWIVPGGHFNVACDVFLLLAVGRDLAVDGKLHRVYRIALPLLVAGQAISEWARHTGWWQALAWRILQ